MRAILGVLRGWGGGGGGGTGASEHTKETNTTNNLIRQSAAAHISAHRCTHAHCLPGLILESPPEECRRKVEAQCGCQLHRKPAKQGPALTGRCDLARLPCIGGGGGGAGESENTNNTDLIRHGAAHINAHRCASAHCLLGIIWQVRAKNVDARWRPNAAASCIESPQSRDQR
jgi:hypothetical protein